jgi:hypothetical protein
MADVILPERYDHPNFTVRRQQYYDNVQAPDTSATDFAIFRTRNKAIVTNCIVTCRSLPSAKTTWSLRVMRGGATTIAMYVLSGFSLVAHLSAVEIAITADNTLASAGNFVSLEMGATDKGKFDVLWEYRFLPS